MNELTEAISSEQPFIPEKKAQPVETKSEDKIDTAKLDSTAAIVHEALEKGAKPSIAFSGGADSLVLLDLLSRIALQKMPVIWIDTQMEYPGTKEYIKEIVAAYGFKLRIAKAARKPTEQWQATGWPMLGKMPARRWMQKNKGMGFAINVSECCRAMKIVPARQLIKNLGCDLQFTGQRGKKDDSIRGLRYLKDGSVFFQARDRIWIANPLTGWTDKEIKIYSRIHKLPQHPAKKRGAATIGCVYCGGGSQYQNSGFRILRKTWPEAWHRFIVQWGGGLIILAIKYNRHIQLIQDAVKELGGLKKLAKTKPYLFDFTRRIPLRGYNK